MRFSTIWTIRAMSLRERLNRTGEWALINIAHRVPQRLAYRVLIDQGVRAIRQDEVIPEVPFMKVLERSGRGFPGPCTAALNIAGEHFGCDFDYAPHKGLAHSSRTGEAIWTDDPDALRGAWAGAEAAGR